MIMNWKRWENIVGKYRAVTLFYSGSICIAC